MSGFGLAGLYRLIDDAAGAVSVCSNAKQKERPTQQITDKDKAQLPTAKQPETEERENQGESRRVSAISHRKPPQDRQQTETDGERKSQIQYQLIPSSLPKSKLP